MTTQTTLSLQRKQMLPMLILKWWGKLSPGVAEYGKYVRDFWAEEKDGWGEMQRFAIFVR